MKAWRTALLLALLLAGPAFAGGTPDSATRRSWPAAGAAASEEILSFTLDNDVYAAVREGFPDLRILDRQDGGEVPYALEQINERRSDWSVEFARPRRPRCVRWTVRGSKSSSAWPTTPQMPAA